MNAPASLHLIGSRKSGGAERFYSRLVNALHARGAPVAAANPPGSAVSAEIDPSIPQHAIAMRSVFDLPARFRIRRLVKATRPEIVQSYLGRATRLTHVGGTGAVHIARLGGYYDIKGYRHADAWIGNTRGICDYLLAQGLPAERVIYIGNFVPEAGASSADPADTRRRHGIPTDALLLLAVGRLHPNKGMGDLLEAFARLPREAQGRELHLAIVGDGPLAQELHARARELELTPRLHWLGWQSEPAPFYRSADVFVCPSRHEPLGNVILEAWQYAVPVVSTRTLGAEELVAHERDGLLCEVGDPAALARVLAGLLEAGPVAWRALVAAGAAKIAAEHSEAKVTEQYLALYQQLTRNRS